MNRRGFIQSLFAAGCMPRNLLVSDTSNTVKPTYFFAPPCGWVGAPTGLFALNSAVSADWVHKTPQEILKDMNYLLYGLGMHQPNRVIYGANLPILKTSRPRRSTQRVGQKRIL